MAVNGVSLTIGAGEAVGLIGGNGAGKSTLLRIASGLTRPSSGTVRVPANTAAVLSLGEAFALDLSGVENAITTAIVSGFTPRQARDLLPTIISYAELEDAAHAPVRTYSEGMKLRLAFAVVAQLRPAALLIDEVMSVGDISFQAKSYGRITEALAEGSAVLMASHDLHRLTTSCDRIAWLEHGQIRQIGDPVAVVTAYEQQMMEETTRRTPSHLAGQNQRVGSQEMTIDGLRLVASTGSSDEPTIQPGAALTVTWELNSRASIELPPILAVVIADELGNTVASATTASDGIRVPRDAKEHAMAVRFERLDLVPGRYAIEVGAYRADWQYAFDLHAAALHFNVVGPVSAHGVLNPPRTWT